MITEMDLGISESPSTEKAESKSRTPKLSPKLGFIVH